MDPGILRPAPGGFGMQVVAGLIWELFEYAVDRLSGTPPAPAPEPQPEQEQGPDV